MHSSMFGPWYAHGTFVAQASVGIELQACLIWMLLSGGDSEYPRHSSDSPWWQTPAAHHRFHSYVCPWWWLCIWTSCNGEGSWKSIIQLPLRSDFKWTYILHLAAVFFCSGNNSCLCRLHPAIYGSSVQIVVQFHKRVLNLEDLASSSVPNRRQNWSLSVQYCSWNWCGTIYPFKTLHLFLSCSSGEL